MMTRRNALRKSIWGGGFIDTSHPVRKGRGWIWSMLSVQLPWVSRARVYLLARGVWSPLQAALVIQKANGAK